MPQDRDTFVMEAEGAVVGIAIGDENSSSAIIWNYSASPLPQQAPASGAGYWLILNRSHSPGPRMCSPACRILMRARAPFTASKATRKSAPCRIFSFQATARFCFVRRLVRQGQREVIRRNGKIVIEILFGFFTGIIWQAAQNIPQQAVRNEDPEAYAGRYVEGFERLRTQLGDVFSSR